MVLMEYSDLKEEYEKEKRIRQWRKRTRLRNKGDHSCLNDVRIYLTYLINMIIVEKAPASKI